ncbi:DUF4062 domain-containing protein [Undibacterium sp. Ji83W]|uniref:DUF4062 domain-containing protein n=1 Tax=Undibacterium sp. Ji83W TaxID=3413043 RepID=UPI003BF3CCF7
MAIPKVFVSSTCFDLSEVREQLKKFIDGYGFDAVLSEHGDVFYHPDLHTHEACVHEVSNCQLFILIIGGRFGGTYIADKDKSITNAEYIAARENNIPVFVYIKESVFSSHLVYGQNKKNPFVAQIDYPGIEKQEHAIDIFRFVDDVRKSSRNNALETFSIFADIESHLRKQWAGMIYDMLKSREIKAQMVATNNLIAEINSSSQKLEELVKSLYRSSDKENAEKEIHNIEVSNLVERFFVETVAPEWISKSDKDERASYLNVKKISAVSPDGLNWHEYLVATGMFENSSYYDYEEKTNEEVIKTSDDFFRSANHFAFHINKNTDISRQIANLYETGICRSSAEQRLKALSAVIL